MKKTALIAIALTVLITLGSGAAIGADKFKIAWSHYTGWEPWEYTRHSEILKKWADKYGIEIELTLINDYIESINLFTGGGFDGCTMTNMDALTIPAVGGVDSTVLIIGDFSNGNDGIVVKGGDSVAALKGREVNLVELSVSHYLLVRALSMSGMQEKDLTVVNTSDSDIAAVFSADPNGAAVTWNPPLMQCRNAKGANLVFDSSRIPGEIIDLMVVRSNTPDTLKKALVGAWYETMAVMSDKSKQGKEAIAYMAQFAGGTEAEFRAQLRTTQMFYNPSESLSFVQSDKLKETMEYVRTFSFDHGLFGDAESKDFVGIQFPDGTVMGDKSNIKMRFDDQFVKMAAEGKL